MQFFEVSIQLIHVFAVISWLGAMYFNLVLIFPTYKAAFTDIEQEKRMYQVQGTKAAYWLYAFIFFTSFSGAIFVYLGDVVIDSFLIIKVSFLLIMLAMHLFGSYYIWPRIMFAVGSEVRSLIFLYKGTMFISAFIGTMAVSLSYSKHLIF